MPVNTTVRAVVHSPCKAAPLGVFCLLGGAFTLRTKNLQNLQKKIRGVILKTLGHFRIKTTEWMETNSSEWNFHKKETHTLQVRHLAKSMRQKSPFSASKGKLKVACRRGLVACCAHPRPNARRCTGVAIKQRYSKVMYTQYDTRKAFVSGKQHDLNSNMNTSSTNFNTPRN